jgi:hypothetical protein
VTQVPELSTDFAVDLLEVLADAQLEEGLARDLPLLGSLIKVARIGRSASDALLLAKVRVFMRSVADVSDDERSRFASLISLTHHLSLPLPFLYPNSLSLPPPSLPSLLPPLYKLLH